MISDKNKEAVINKAKELIKENNVENLEVLEIREVNFKPHTPVIGLKAFEGNHLPFIDDDLMCSHPGCNLKLGEHHGDIVLFLKLNNVVDKTKAQKILTELADTLTENRVDGFAFVQENSNCVFK